MTIERGIRQKPNRSGFEAYVRVNGRTECKYFRGGTPIEDMRAWRKEARSRNVRPLDVLFQATPPPRVETGGYVYFVQMFNDIKIGSTRDVARRLEELQTAHAQTLRLVGHFYATQPRRIEAQLQKEFHESRARGEWFRMTPDIRRLIRAKAQYS
jgi:hypothetical protein